MAAAPPGHRYETLEERKTLRYGHVMIMADQDHDGSHIKGLVINLIHSFWPALLRHDGFLQQFVTPIMKVSSGFVRCIRVCVYLHVPVSTTMHSAV